MNVPEMSSVQNWRPLRVEILLRLVQAKSRLYLAVLSVAAVVLRKPQKRWRCDLRRFLVAALQLALQLASSVDSAPVKVWKIP